MSQVRWSRAGIAFLIVFVSVPLLGICGAARAASRPSTAAVSESTLVLRCNETLLQCIRLSRIGPPMVSRAIGVSYTCGFDAWACYDTRAISTRPDAPARRPSDERTLANRETAFGFAFHRALLDLFPGHAALIRTRMAAAGFDPDNTSSDATQPAGIGNLCAAAVLNFRHADGSNQLGNLHAGAYSDYTGYTPVNSVEEIADPNHWQPLRFSDGAGGFVVPRYIGAQWGLVTPFALATPAQFRPPGPARFPSGAYVSQINEVLRLNAHLGDREKMIAEYWADGPRSELPPGHWTLFGEFVSLRDGHDFDQDVKMFFALGNAVMDAGIAVWEGKRYFDSERPITAIRFLKRGKSVLATVPFADKQVIRGENWLPYQPPTFITPPFPEYPSGHSAFSSASAEILKRFAGSDAFGGSVTLAAGSSRVEPGVTPSAAVTLSWATFGEAADEAGFSRRLGGIHFEDGDLDSRALGRRVAAAVWERAQGYINGGPVPAVSSMGGESLARGEGREEGAANADRTGAKLVLGGVRPNPSSGPLRVEFALGSAAHARFSVVDLQGREVAELANGDFPAGTHLLRWTGMVDGRRASPGVYFLRGVGAGVSLSRRVVLVD